MFKNTRTSQTSSRGASECSHFRTCPSLQPYLAPIKFDDNISNGSRVIAFTNAQTNKQTETNKHTNRETPTDGR